MLKLIEPEIHLEEGFKQLVWDYIRAKETKYINLYLDALQDFKSYMNMLQAHKYGAMLPEGWVRYHSYWLIDDANPHVIIGNLRIRDANILNCGHIGYDIRPSYRKKGYGYNILKLGLEKARSIEKNDLIIVSDSTNESSKRIIQKNGGVYAREFIDIHSKKRLTEFKFSHQ